MFLTPILLILKFKACYVDRQGNGLVRAVKHQVMQRLSAEVVGVVLQINNSWLTQYDVKHTNRQ